MIAGPIKAKKWLGSEKKRWRSYKK